MDTSKIKVDHPEFRYVTLGKYPLVFVFERPTHKEVTPEALADYRAKRHVVELLGGRMLMHEGEIAEKNEPFNTFEVLTMKMAVLASVPPNTLIIMETWNGRGYHTLSVGCVKVSDQNSYRELYEAVERRCPRPPGSRMYD